METGSAALPEHRERPPLLRGMSMRSATNLPPSKEQDIKQKALMAANIRVRRDAKYSRGRSEGPDTEDRGAAVPKVAAEVCGRQVRGGSLMRDGKLQGLPRPPARVDGERHSAVDVPKKGSGASGKAMQISAGALRHPALAKPLLKQIEVCKELKLAEEAAAVEIKFLFTDLIIL